MPKPKAAPAPKKKIGPPKKIKKPDNKAATPEPVEENEIFPSDAFPVVGVGASAGGLEAFEQFFAKMPLDIGMAFVLVPHLDPGHSSMMTELLSRITKLSVEEAENGKKVLPNHVYVIPPNKEMSISDRVLHLEPLKKDTGIRMPIDFFFRSLAADQGEMAIGVILSGTGTDGTLGIRAIHGAGGAVMVQSPDSAKYTGMPDSVLNTGLADYILPPDMMADQLKIYSNLFRKKGRPLITGEDILKQILNLIRIQTGHDLSLYKKTTVNRRIEKRMTLLGLSSTLSYFRHLKEHPEEVLALFKNLLIGVTQFFRDQEAFETLKAELKKYLREQPEGGTFRAWVPACGTGEEAFSMAMLALECLEELKRDIKIQVFGTDIDTEAINLARNGLYSANIGVDVNAHRLRRYFSKEDNMFRVKKEVRELIVFAPQDITKDPSFTKLDLLSCRNLLIYLENELQNKILPLFHYSLKPGGLLFLGNSETVGRFTGLFTVMDRKAKIFQAKKILSPAREETWRAFPWVGEQARGEKETWFQKEKEIDISAAAQKMLLETFAPPSVIANEKGEILYINGQTGKYLEPAPGRPNWNIFDMGRQGLQFEIRSGIHYALTRQKERRFERLMVKTNHEFRMVNLTIRPFSPSRETKGLVVVLFEDVVERVKRKPEAKPEKPVSDKKNQLLEAERELQYTRESLQATVEELQASNEELKSVNEEMQSTNEELQSSNEELETSREELQSINEELTTVNSELQAKIDQLTKAESDLKILLENTHIGLIFLDNRLRIERYTSKATRMFNLIPGDIGRPLHDIRSNLNYDDIEKDAGEVLENLQSLEKEVLTKEGEWYLMRIMPYRSSVNTIEGVVLTLTDISDVKRAGDTLSAVVETVREPMVVLDGNFRIAFANQTFYRTFQVSKEETENRLLFEVDKGQWDIKELRKLLGEILPQGHKIENFIVEHNFPKIGSKRLILNARKILEKKGTNESLILLAMEDISGRPKANSETNRK